MEKRNKYLKHSYITKSYQKESIPNKPPLKLMVEDAVPPLPFCLSFLLLTITHNFSHGTTSRDSFSTLYSCRVLIFVTSPILKVNRVRN